MQVLKLWQHASLQPSEVQGHLVFNLNTLVSLYFDFGGEGGYSTILQGWTKGLILRPKQKQKKKNLLPSAEVRSRRFLKLKFWRFSHLSAKKEFWKSDKIDFFSDRYEIVTCMHIFLCLPLQAWTLIIFKISNLPLRDHPNFRGGRGPWNSDI